MPRARIFKHRRPFPTARSSSAPIERFTVSGRCVSAFRSRASRLRWWSGRSPAFSRLKRKLQRSLDALLRLRRLPEIANLAGDDAVSRRRALLPLALILTFLLLSVSPAEPEEATRL